MLHCFCLCSSACAAVSQDPGGTLFRQSSLPPFRYVEKISLKGFSPLADERLSYVASLRLNSEERESQRACLSVNGHSTGTFFYVYMERCFAQVGWTVDESDGALELPEIRSGH